MSKLWCDRYNLDIVLADVNMYSEDSVLIISGCQVIEQVKK